MSELGGSRSKNRIMYRVTGWEKYLGKAVGTGQCVALLQAMGVPLTKEWRRGKLVKGAKDLEPGVCIATFGWDEHEQDWRYQNKTDGSSHAAIYLGQDKTGIQSMDQWKGQVAHYRTIRFKGGPPEKAVNDGSQFWVIEGAHGDNGDVAA